MKYSDAVIEWLAEAGYTHCFFVAGGNIMHLLDSARSRMTCVPFVHEVAAGIAAEYFNEVQDERRAFALVTAGPGLTNILTAMAGAHLESRDLLVLGGQVKSSDLADGAIRQRGIQEIDGVTAARPFTKRSVQLREPWDRPRLLEVVAEGRRGRRGPVFIEMCLDVQGGGVPSDPSPSGPSALSVDDSSRDAMSVATVDTAPVVRWLAEAQRPVLLIGGGLTRHAAARLMTPLRALGAPIATTWNAADRIDASDPLYFGRPNTWGMRWSNILLQQADLIIAVGTRLGLQQTGFNWPAFGPLARVVQVDVDPAELSKGHPRIDLAIESDAAEFLESLLRAAAGSQDLAAARARWTEWATFGREVREALPLTDPANLHAEGYVDPYAFIEGLSRACGESDVIIPCSSGGAFTVMMQTFSQRPGQTIVTDKGLASMGYGLSGAIGAALARPDARVILVEGDGGFAQNLQEIGTAVAQRLDLKMFIFANNGYASIRMTQRRYFGGAYVGCDLRTGLGLPDWSGLFSAYRTPVLDIDPRDPFSEEVMTRLGRPGPDAFIVPIDPEQTYFPKIDSRVTASGAMESNPLHLMSPPLDTAAAQRLMPHLMRSDLT